MRELEIYSRIEPIGGMVGVSEPPPPEAEGMDEQQAKSLFDRIRRTLQRKGH